MVQLRSQINKAETEAVSSQPQEVKVKWLGFYLGLWLTSVFFFPLASRMFLNGGFLQLSYVLAILWPEVLFLFILKCKMPKKLKTNDMIAIVLFFVAILISSIVSVDKVNTALFFILTIFVFVIILQFKTNLIASQYFTAFKTYSFLALMVALMFAVHDYRPGMRLGNGTDILNPNAISIVLMSIVISAMSFNLKLVKVGVAAVAVYLLYLTGSRTSLVAMVIGVFIYTYYSTKMSTKFYKFVLVFSVVLAIGLGFTYMGETWNAINGVLKVDDSHRGITTGASGRLDIWIIAWNLFLENIITGIGYRTHETVLGISAHNGYLATLLEIGVIGFASIMYLIVKGLLVIKSNLTVNVENNYNALLFGLCLGYMFLALFERYLINIGNPASLIFILSILSPVYLGEK